MDNDTYMKIEKALSNYTYDTITGKQAKKVIKSLGYIVDLRTWLFNMIDVESIETGELTTIEV